MKKQLVLVMMLAMLLVACGGMEADAPDDSPQGAANEASEGLVPPRDDAAHRLENPAGEREANSQTPYDLRYINYMIAHHEEGLGMAKVAVQDAESDEIREMAQDMIQMHEHEIEQLRAWRDEWYPEAAESDADGATGRLVVRDESFDGAFLKAMVAHHASAYRLSREAFHRAEHDELREFAQMIMDNQSAEMDRMQQMLHDSVTE